MFLIIAGVVVGLIALILIIAALKPGEFRVRRALAMSAPMDRVFSNINDFHKWNAWSPWEKLDPELKRTFSGAASGPGAIYEWIGNKKVGQGRMEIIGSNPSSLVRIKLDFIAPFAAHNTTEFTIEPRGQLTNVTWTMTGHSPYMMKVMGLFMNMDRMIGNDFETGLANMKAINER